MKWQEQKKQEQKQNNDMLRSNLLNIPEFSKRKKNGIKVISWGAKLFQENTEHSFSS